MLATRYAIRRRKNHVHVAKVSKGKIFLCKGFGGKVSQVLHPKGSIGLRTNGEGRTRPVEGDFIGLSGCKANAYRLTVERQVATISQR